MTQLLTTIFILICVTLVHCEQADVTYTCGPDRTCTCRTDNVSDSSSSSNGTYTIAMDCTSRHLTMIDICASLKADSSETGDVSAVKHLKAGENNMGNLQADDVSGCEGLLTLDLHYNQMTAIYTDTFTGFTQLQVLDLTGNNLDVYTDTFNHTVLPTTLKQLHLNGNIQTWNNSASHRYPDLSNLKSLTVLYMDGLPTSFGAVYRTMSIRNLTLSGLQKYTFCNISEVLDGTFENLVHVTQLDISCCSITNIYAGAFVKMVSLERLDLSYNRQLGFDPMMNVTYGLQFTNIHFLNLTKVHTTFGFGTQILKRDICYLRNTSLREISLNSNRIQAFESNALILVPNSTHIIHVEDNIFTFAPYVLQVGCVQYGEHFYGSYQNMAHDPKMYIFEEVDNGKRARSTSSHCPYMTDISLKWIAKGNPYCQFLHPGQVIQFPPKFSKWTKTVEFRDSGIKYNLDANIKIRPPDNTIEYLDFSGNILYSWQAQIGPMPHLKHLDLSRNYCTYIGPNFFRNMTVLQNLQIQSNFLGTFFADAHNSDVFKELTHLRTLNISGNRITLLHASMFLPLRQLQQLDLSYNQIEIFDLDLSKLKQLLVLNLRFNFIRSLSEMVTSNILKNAAYLNSTFSIDLRNNSIAYTCDNVAFIKWLITHDHNMVGVRDYEYRDSGGNTFTWHFITHDIRNLERNCKSYTAIIVLCSISVSVFMGIVIGGLIYRNRWKLRFILYMRYKTKADALLHDYKYDAFISYAEENIGFMKRDLIPKLEDEEDMSLCLHQRDFIAGINIADNIIDAITHSRRTVVFLSPIFVQKKWCMYEFNMARMKSIYSGDDTNCLIVVMLEDVPAKDMPLEMLDWIQTNNYIEYTTDQDGVQLFWDRLITALQP